MPEAYSSKITPAANGSADRQELDPLQVEVPLEFHHVLFPFGFPTHIRTNDLAVIRAAEISWAAFEHSFGLRPIEIRVVVSDIVSRRLPPAPTFRAQWNLLMLVADKYNFGCCDLSSGFGFASLTKAATTHKDYLRYYFLEAMVYALLDTQHMVAIHAACVAFQGRGTLFVGDSGAGKSSFAYACTRRGWTYISDDSTSLILHKTGRHVVGNPQTIRFRPSGLSLFPELRGRTALRNGKPTIEIRTETLRHFNAAYGATINHIVFLNRSELAANSASLNRISSRETLRRLSRNPWPPELAINEQRSEAIVRLLGAEAFELTYWDLNSAIDLLENSLRGETL